MRKLTTGFIVFGFLWGFAAMSQAATYTYETLSYPGATSTNVTAINNDGKIVGTYSIFDGSTNKTFGFIYRYGRFEKLPSAGTCTRPAGYGFPETTYDIVVIPRGINAAGHIVGTTKACGRHRGFILNGSIYKQVHQSGANSTYVAGINNLGTAVGGYTWPTIRTGAFTYQNGYLKPFTHPDSPDRMSLTDINDAGFMMGAYSPKPWDGGGEFIYDPLTYQFTSFVIPNAEPLSTVTAFNNMGQIIGISITNNGADRKGLLYDSVNGFTGIDVPESGSGWTIPTDINDSGVIVGHYYNATGHSGFIATPNSAPTPVRLPLPVDTYDAPTVELNAPASAELGAEGVRDYLVADFNGGGAADLMIAHGDGKTIVYFGETKDGELFNDKEKLAAVSTWGTSVKSIEPGDFNNDGIIDIFLDASTCDNVRTDLPVMLGVGDGTFTLASCISRSESAGYIDTYVSGTGVGDVNEDGNDDIAISVTGNYGAKGIYLYLGNGDGTFTTRQVITTLNRTSDLAMGDFNGDGHVDILVRTTSIRLYRGDGAGNFSLSGYSGRWPEDQADINNDSYTDNITTKEGRTVVYPGNPDGGFNYTPLIFDLTASGTRVFADFNGDGLPDLVFLNGAWGSNAEAVLYTQVGAPVIPDPVPAPEPVPEPTPDPTPEPDPTPGDIPAIDPAAVEDHEFKGTITEVGASYVVINDTKTWYTSTTEITTEGDVAFTVGMEAQAQGWLNPDGEVIALVLEGW